MDTYKDNWGYERYTKEYTNSVHRNRVYHIYLENRKKYPLPFSAYEVHHKDFNKNNNKVSNLMIVTPTEHDRIHDKEKQERERIRKETEEIFKKRKTKKFIWILVVVLIAISLFSIFNRLENQPEKENTPPTPLPEVKPLVVEGSKTEVIIKNNQEKKISLNVTYRIYSKWFGTDYQENRVFDVGANSQQSFKVYNNAGCSTAPCSVIIISYWEV